MAASDPMIGSSYPAESCVYTENRIFFLAFQNCIICGFTKINMFSDLKSCVICTALSLENVAKI